MRRRNATPARRRFRRRFLRSATGGAALVATGAEKEKKGAAQSPARGSDCSRPRSGQGGGSPCGFPCDAVLWARSCRGWRCRRERRGPLGARASKRQRLGRGVEFARNDEPGLLDAAAFGIFTKHQDHRDELRAASPFAELSTENLRRHDAGCTEDGGRRTSRSPRCSVSSVRSGCTARSTLEPDPPPIAARGRGRGGREPRRRR